MSEIGNIGWSSGLEDYFSDQGEQAHGLSLLHKQSESLYSSRRTYVELPVIAISSVTGFLSVGSTTMFVGQQMTASIILGILSLLVSVVQTIGTYFAWAKRAEGHRISSIQYSRLHRHLKIEMGLPRDERQLPGDLLKYVRDAIDRLQETSPLLPPQIVDEYKRKYSGITDISHPPETNGLEKIVVYHEAPPRPSSLQRLETLGLPSPKPNGEA